MSERDDEFDALYRRLNSRDPERPGAHIQRAVLEEAGRIAAGRRRGTLHGLLTRGSRWVGSLFAVRGVWPVAGSLAAAALAVVMILPQLRSAAPRSALITSIAPTASTTPPRPTTAATPTTAAAPSAPATPPETGNMANSTAARPAEPSSFASSPRAKARRAPATEPGSDAFPALAQAAPQPHERSDEAPAVPADVSSARAEPSITASVASVAPDASAGAAAPAAPPAAPAVDPKAARSEVTAERANAITPVPAPPQLLWRALETADLDALQRALDAGAPLEMRDAAGHTPLLFAIERRNLPAVRLLLARGADPGAPDPQGRRPLERARAMGLDEIAAALQRAGAQAP